MRLLASKMLLGFNAHGLRAALNLVNIVPGTSTASADARRCQLISRTREKGFSRQVGPLKSRSDPLIYEWLTRV